MAMNKTKALAITLLLLLVVLGGWLFLPPRVGDAVIPNSPDAIARGEYLVTAGGCISCHKRSEEDLTLAGGYAVDSPFGTFYSPNITPDPETGIGDWSAKDFLRALKHGRTPGGSFYYPAFPYRAYAGLTDQDVLDIAAYLVSLQPVVNSVPEHQLPGWLNRWAIAGWNRMADITQPSLASFDQELLARGAYLARNLGHCGECHTPRSGLGIPDLRREFAGAELGDEVVEAIDASALEEWTQDSFDLFLLIGLKPDGEFVGGDMADVLEYNTTKLTDADRAALAAFFTRHNE